jgi:hypothetical protein
MGNYIGLHDNGKSSVQGIMDIFSGLFSSGVDLVNNANSWKVSQRGAGANMSVDIAAGRGFLADTLIHYAGWSDAVNNVVIGAADPTNPRRDIIVAYMDESVPNTGVTNNDGALKFKAVSGTPAGSPSDPSDPTIQSSVGAGNPYIKLARVTVPASSTTVVDANITDLRQSIQIKANVITAALADQAVTTPKIADDAVTNAKIGPAAVGDTELKARFAEIISDYVFSGGVIAIVSGRQGSFSNIVYYIGGVRYTLTEANKTYTATKDTYVDVNTSGAVVYTEVSVGAAAPSLAANHLRVAKVTTDASNITAITQTGVDSNNIAVYPTNNNGFGSSKTWNLAATGFSGTPTTSDSNYVKVGRWVFGYLAITGTSNSTATTFQLPFTPKNAVRFQGLTTSDNGAALTTPGMATTAAGNLTATLYKNHDPGATWTSSGAKAIRGHFMYEAES